MITAVSVILSEKLHQDRLLHSVCALKNPTAVKPATLKDIVTLV
jgi:hypothetical protein